MNKKKFKFEPLLGIMEVQRRGFNHIIIEEDSSIVASAINPFPNREEWKIHEIVRNIWMLLQVTSRWKVKFICRDANGVAHHLPRRLPPEFLLKITHLFLSTWMGCFGCMRGFNPLVVFVSFSL